MQPRGFGGTFVVMAGVTALPFGLLWSWLFSLTMGLDFSQVLAVGIWGGVAFGLIFGFVMAFFMKAVTLSVGFQDKGTFVSNRDLLHVQTTFQAGLLAGKISVQVEPGSAVIVGPSTYVKKLRKRIQ